MNLFEKFKVLENIRDIREKAVKSIVYTINNDEIKTINDYYIVDYEMKIDRLEKVIKDYCNIECGLHWRLDVIMNEDYSKIKVGNSIIIYQY